MVSLPPCLWCHYRPFFGVITALSLVSLPPFLWCHYRPFFGVITALSLVSLPPFLYNNFDSYAEQISQTFGLDLKILFWHEKSTIKESNFTIDFLLFCSVTYFLLFCSVTFVLRFMFVVLFNENGSTKYCMTKRVHRFYFFFFLFFFLFLFFCKTCPFEIFIKTILKIILKPSLSVHYSEH